MWWIKKKDKPSYDQLMGPDAKILQETDDYLQVVFSASAMQVWVQCGYWYGGSPAFLSGIYQKCLTFVKKVL